MVADGAKLKQTLYNLVSNAVKFSPNGGEVKISVRLLPEQESPLPSETVEITVRDHGIGINRYDQRRIFEEFQQVSSSIARRFGGTGLGLALVKRYGRVARGHDRGGVAAEQRLDVPCLPARRSESSRGRLSTR